MKNTIVLISLLVGFFSLAGRVHAQLPVTDVANLSNSIIHQVKEAAQWVKEIEEMNRQYQQLRQTYEQAKQTYDLNNLQAQIKGDIRNCAAGIMAPANNVLGAQRSLLQPLTLDDIANRVNPTRALVTNLRYNSGQIGEYFYVGNNIVWRDKAKYKGYEMERMALESLWKAVTDQQKLEETEFAEIDRNQRILAGRPSESDAQMAQTALDASRTRLQTMALRAERAEAAAKNLAQQRELEERMLEQKAKDENAAYTADAQEKAVRALDVQRTFIFRP